MNKELQLSYLGISDEQIAKIDSHMAKVKSYVYKDDPGIGESYKWLEGQMGILPKEYASALYEIAKNNEPSGEISYNEEGYDSCQSHRKLSKVIGESMLLGGLVYEYGLLGIQIDIEQAKSIVKSKLNVDVQQSQLLPVIAKEFGSSQDFIFPGVTPSSKDTPTLEEYTYSALSGNPQTSVRSVLGVGGLRFDKDWNYATDFSTFVNLKIEEDKRYYPGIGIYFALLNLEKSEIPVLSNQILASLAESIKNVQKKEFQGVSVLCSAYVPLWNEIKDYQYNSGYDLIELAESFHSPAYEFSEILKVVENLPKVEQSQTKHAQLEKLKAKLGNVWSFNSTIHLPWTSELAGFSNDLMGSITNNVGDWAIKYGVGWAGMSLEIKEYHFGQGRKFPPDLEGKVAYALSFYPNSMVFEGDVQTSDLLPDSAFWKEIKKNGFMAAALDKLKSIKV